MNEMAAKGMVVSFRVNSLCGRGFVVVIVPPIRPLAFHVHASRSIVDACDTHSVFLAGTIVGASRERHVVQERAACCRLLGIHLPPMIHFLSIRIVFKDSNVSFDHAW